MSETTTERHRTSHETDGDERRDAGRAQDEEERERYRELLEELRTIIPGVQVLFAFLLTAPFSAAFERLDGLGRDLYAVVLVGVGLAIAVFLTPAAFHRVNGNGDRATRLRIGVRCTVAGLTLLAACIVVSVFVVVRFVFDTTLAWVLATVVATAFVALWYALGIVRRTAREG